MAAFSRLSGGASRLWGMLERRGSGCPSVEGLRPALPPCQQTSGHRLRGISPHSMKCVCDFPWSLPSIFSGPPRATERVKQGPLQTEEGWRGGGTKGRHQGEHVRSDTQGKSNRAKLHAVVCFSWEEPWEGILRICANLQSPLHHITDTGDNRALESFKDKEKKLHYVDTTKQTDVFSLPPVAALSLLLTCFGNWTFQLWYLKKTSLFP